MNSSSALPAELRPAMPTALYRIYGEDDALLYVGISIQPRRRFTDHTREHWWHLARRHTLEWVEDRHEAERRERTAIRTEDPIWNREHKDPGKLAPRTRAYVADIRDGKVT